MDAATSLSLYVDQLLTDKHKGVDIPEDVKQTMKQELIQTLDEFVMLKMIETLSPEDAHALDTLAASDKPEDIKGFLAAHIPDQTHIVTNAFLEFRELYLAQ